MISQGESHRYILLYHFLHWLDHDVPNDESSILELLVRVYDDRNLSPDTPILVHCSAGCGRTGSIIAIDLCRSLIRDEVGKNTPHNLPSTDVIHVFSVYSQAKTINRIPSSKSRLTSVNFVLP